ncbi:MAG: hypothetical protein QXW97_03335 [Candidatus Pacearchaeota archaeon]
MGFFDFLKRKKQEIKLERVKIENIDEFLKLRIEKIKNQEHEIFLLVNTKLLYLINDLKEQIKVLETINLEDKKVEARTKFIVKENFNHYVNHIKKLIENLQNIKTENVYLLIELVDKIFLDFDKKSKLNYEKATFLIGKELGETKDKINNFFSEVKSILSKNKNILEENKIYISIKNKLNELKELDKSKDEINSNIKENNEKIKRLQIEIDIKESRINDIKKSFEYLKEQESIKRKEDDYKIIEKMIYDLKQLIDFKKLANIFHYDSKKMDIINKYKVSFKNNFEKDNGIEILNLLSEANMTSSHISKKITEIKEKIKELEKKYRNLELKQLQIITELNKDVKELNFKKEDLILVNAKENKKLEKLNESEKLITDDIKKELLKLNVELVE